MIKRLGFGICFILSVLFQICYAGYIYLDRVGEGRVVYDFKNIKELKINEHNNIEFFDKEKKVYREYRGTYEIVWSDGETIP